MNNKTMQNQKEHIIMHNNKVEPSLSDTALKS